MSFYRGTGTPGTGTAASRPVRLDELAASDGSSLVGFIQSGAGAVATTMQAKARERVSVKDFGAAGDGSTDDYSAIEKGLTYVRTTGGCLFFPASTGNYMHSQSLQFGASNVTIEGESTDVTLQYTGVGTGLLINSSGLSPQRERCALRKISLYSTTGAIAFDFTGGNYGNYQDFEIQYTTASAKLIYAIGSSGAGPYFNQFSGFSLFGGSDRTQTGIWFASDTSGNLADGPNANVISDLKRGASMNRLVNIVAGVGNMFTNIGGESIKDAMIVLNDIPSYSDTGTVTSATTNTLTDSTKTWSTVIGNATNWVNGAVLITSGAYVGESRKIVLNTATTLTLDKSWPTDIGTPNYAIVKSKAVNNKFVNVRQEGLSTDNPDGIRIMPGALSNEFSQLEIGSIGSGEIIDDQYGETSNKIRIGDISIQQFIVENPGPGATVEIVPRSSVYGGIRAGSNMILEWIEFKSPNFVGGVATLTVDHGGSAAGNGSETLVAKLNSFNTKESFVSSKLKVPRSTANNGIFVNLATDASVNAAADFIITVAYRVI